MEARQDADTLIGQISLAFYSMPDFWLGMLFIGFFAGTLAWLPGGLKSTPGGRRRGCDTGRTSRRT